MKDYGYKKITVYIKPEQEAQLEMSFDQLYSEFVRACELTGAEKFNEQIFYRGIMLFGAAMLAEMKRAFGVIGEKGFEIDEYHRWLVKAILKRQK